MSWERLGDAVRRRRKELALTQPDVTDRGGPSVETLRAIENNRAGRMSQKSRRALERAIDWEAGSIEAVLDGAAPRELAAAPVARTQPSAPPTEPEATSKAAERFAMAERLIKMRQALTTHRDTMPEAARSALEQELTAAVRETENALIRMLPWLGDEERGAAIRILAGLRGE